MAIQLVDAVLKHSAHRGATRMVHVVLANAANNRAGATCYPSVATIAREAGICVRSAQAALQNLFKTGEVMDVGEARVLLNKPHLPPGLRLFRVHAPPQSTSYTPAICDTGPPQPLRTNRNLEPEEEPFVGESSKDLFGEPTTTASEPKDDGPPIAEGFKEFWSIYQPLRRGRDNPRKTAEAEYARARKRASHAQIMQAVRDYADERERTQDQDERAMYTKQAWRWLKAHEFGDIEVRTPEKSKQPKRIDPVVEWVKGRIKWPAELGPPPMEPGFRVPESACRPALGLTTGRDADRWDDLDTALKIRKKAG